MLHPEALVEAYHATGQRFAPDDRGVWILDSRSHWMNISCDQAEKGLLALPTMLRRGYDPAIATGTLAATGTLGQIIPPSIVLVLLGDVMSSAYQQAQLQQGVFAPETVSVGDLFAGALLPGIS